MPAAIQTLSFPGALTQRGFWLYVWRVTNLNGRELLYVGRTGDNSSPNATAPYTRMGQHLTYLKNPNALRAHLCRRGVRPEDCTKFVLIAFGPIYAEVEKDGSDRETLMRRHTPFRDNTAVMEKRLCDGLKAAGYDVMNDVKCRRELTGDGEEQWRLARAAFCKEFPAQKPLDTRLKGHNVLKRADVDSS